MCLIGQKKLFHVKEYLSPKDLQEKGLAPILDAMEVADYTHPGVKKRLLRYVWPDSHRSFEEVFTPYIKERGQFTLMYGMLCVGVSDSLVKWIHFAHYLSDRHVQTCY